MNFTSTKITLSIATLSTALLASAVASAADNQAPRTGTMARPRSRRRRSDSATVNG